MFIAIQFPLVDARPFLPGPTHRLLVPDWLAPRPPVNFIRAFGPLDWRLKGGADEWPAEEVFCWADRAIRFVSPHATTPRLAPSGVPVHPRCVFRRLFSDGRAVARVEVGLRMHKASPWQQPLEAADLLSLLGLALNLPVRVPKDRKPDAAPDAEPAIPLRDAGGELAKRYLRSTTARHPGGLPPADSWWVAPMQPLVLLEYSATEDFSSLPANATVVPTPPASGVTLSYVRLRERGRGEIGVWLLGIDAHPDRDYVRRIRLQLFRLHAEQQAMRHVFGLVNSRRIPADQPGDAFQALQSFLTDAISLLSHRTRFGLPQSEILAAAQRYDESVEAGSRTSLLAALARIRPNLMRNVVQYTEWLEEKAAETPVPTYLIGEINFVDKQTTITNTAGGDLTITNQVVADTITDSFNAVQASSADDALKAALLKLQEDVKLLIPQLPENVQQKAAKNLKALTEEAVAKQPDRDWLKVSSEGLIEAAKTVAAMSAPITVAVQAVLKLLGAG